MSVEALPYGFSSHPALNLPFLNAKTANTRAASTNPVKKDVLELVNQNPTGSSTHNRLLQGLKTVSDDDTLKDLTNTILLINASFTNIDIALGLLDEKNYRKKKAGGSPDGDLIGKLRPVWHAIKNDFNNLIWESQEVSSYSAGHTYRFNQMIDNVLRNEGATLMEKQAEFFQFITELEESQEAAKTMSNKFLKLPERITEVKTRFQVASKEVAANFELKLKNLEKEINQLGYDITKYHGIVQAALAGGNSINKAAEALSKAIEAQNIRKSKIAELKSDIQDQEDSRTVEAKVALALNDTGDLSQRLLSISYVWSVPRFVL